LASQSSLGSDFIAGLERGVVRVHRLPEELFGHQQSGRKMMSPFDLRGILLPVVTGRPRERFHCPAFDAVKVTSPPRTL
jgi:hypothetical protein